MLIRLTLPVQSLLVPTTFTKGGGRPPPPPQLSKKQLPHEPEILQDTFESLRNVKVVYIVFTWLPKQSLKGEVFGGKITRFQSKIPIIQIATKLTIFKITV